MRVLYSVNEFMDMRACMCVRVCVAAAGFYCLCNVVVTNMMRVFVTVW